MTAKLSDVDNRVLAFMRAAYKVVPDDDPLGHLRRVAERLRRIERENGIGERP